MPELQNIPETRVLPTTTLRERILRKPDVLRMVTLSDPTIYRLEKAGKFPKRISLGGNSCGWLESELLAWIGERVAARETEAIRPVPRADLAPLNRKEPRP